MAYKWPFSPRPNLKRKRTCELLRLISVPTLSSSASASLAASTYREMHICLTLWRVTKSLLPFEPKSRLGIDGIVTNRPFLSSLVPQFQNESLGLGPLGLKIAKRFKWRWVWFAWKWTCRRNSFSYEWFCLKTRFDTEAKSRSKMAYWNAPCSLDGGS